ncbi:bifunctional riboflavin kinase/FAD synthetase [Kocuria sp. HSID16901]|uniref:bifunctional riboflavin kinase/FAD synthetase n=1 Tax=Kocuria sp. HSID16901 TaxID=2419505 RepID=UPI000F889064|nr:bifunctional riboflavin kinase/FAD synthetase [Kocuria sp. HSID16901]RUQ21143.1 bifunctional riboflavin kinase/FAD synthetase [Kocuria sp. HSID16901]
MDCFRSLSEIPQGYGETAVTIGNFDGVHRGHTRVIRTVVEEARASGLKAVAISFDPHPALVHRPDVPHYPIMGERDSRDLLAELGLDALVLLPYSLEFAQQTPEDFIRETFVEGLSAKKVVIGADVRFGRNNAGDLETMRHLGEIHGFSVVVVDDLSTDNVLGGLSVDAPHRRCSSTWIRELLAEGDVQSAATLLGRYHRMRGKVVHGAARGRELGFPTANMATDSDGLVPADGVYAGWLHDDGGSRWPVAISVGSNPTFDGVSRQVEAHVMGRPQEAVEDFNLYGHNVLLEFVARLRPMVAYEGMEALIRQMTQDVDDAWDALGGRPA